MRLPTTRLMFVLLLAAASFGCARSGQPPIATGDYTGAAAAESPRAEAAPAIAQGNHWPTAQSPAADGASEHAPSEARHQKSGRVYPERDDAAREESAAPERRRGLATRWGERRDSSVREVSFVRDDSNPFAVLAFRYDDEDGVSYKTGRDADDALPSVFSVRGGAIEVSIVSSGDDPLPQLQARGNTYIVGDTDDRYAIRLTNFTRERYEVVASVDGLDVLTGSEAHYQQRGHILAPWSTLRIEGFRESADSVRAFRFGDVQESYAIGRGYGRDIGVIGVALFDEESARRGRPNEPSPFPAEYAPPPRY